MGRWDGLQNGDISSCVTFFHVYDLKRHIYRKGEHSLSIHPTHRLVSFWRHCGLMDLKIFWNIIILCCHFLMLKSSQIGPLGLPVSKLLWPCVTIPLVKSFLFIWHNKVFQTNVVFIPSRFGICLFPTELHFLLVENCAFVPESGHQLRSSPQWRTRRVQARCLTWRPTFCIFLNLSSCSSLTYSFVAPVSCRLKIKSKPWLGSG